jgi:hypothetical protein
MKLRSLTTAILLGVMGLAAARPSLSQTDLNVELQQALCAQNWGRALQVIEQMKRAAGREYASQLNLYRGQLEAIARENANVPEWANACAGGKAPSGGALSSPMMPASDEPMNSPDFAEENRY